MDADCGCVVKQFSPCACLPPLVKVPPLLLSSICKPPECPKLLLLPPVLLPRPPIVGGLGGRGEAGPLIAFFRKLNRSTIPSLSGLLSLLLKPLITLRISITLQICRHHPHNRKSHIGTQTLSLVTNSQRGARPPGTGPLLTRVRRHTKCSRHQERQNGHRRPKATKTSTSGHQASENP